MVSQVAQFAPQYDVILEDVDVDLRAVFDSTAKYGLSNNQTAFEKVTFRLTIKSPSPLEQVRKLAEHAEMGCHAGQSLQVAVPVSFEVLINGEAVGQFPKSL
jgi:organic hydroperoxide reductase OsmC/OhrA